MVISDNEMPGNIEARKKVCDESETTAASSMHSLVNMIPGEVTAIHQGLLNVGIRIRIGERTDLRVRWPLGSSLQENLVGGSLVKAVIPMEAVHLESGYFRLGKRRWNRWIGRITFVETLHNRRVVWVKLHNDRVSLKCCGSMTGLNWLPQVWDTVNIVVDPTKISLDAGMQIEAAQIVRRDAEAWDPLRDARVWLKAQVTEIGEAPEGKFHSLVIGTARVSVFIDREEDRVGQWSPGMRLDIHVGRYDAWLKRSGSESAPVLCGILFLDSQSLATTR
jgi:hypothetical protein